VSEIPVTTFFTRWRHLPLADREIIEGLVDPQHAGPSPALAHAIERWPGTHYWDTTPEGRTLVLVAEDRAPRERWVVNAALFALALLFPALLALLVWFSRDHASALVLVVLAALFGVGYAGFGILVALRTRNVQATNTSFLLFFPLLFLTPNFVPFDLLSPLMETLARVNPVSYVIDGLRSLVINGWDLGRLAACAGVIVGLVGLLTSLSLRAIATYDR